MTSKIYFFLPIVLQIYLISIYSDNNIQINFLTVTLVTKFVSLEFISFIINCDCELREKFSYF